MVRTLLIASTPLLAVACTAGSDAQPTGNFAGFYGSAPIVPIAPSSLANPASTHCAKLGGRVEIRRGAAGETGYCHLPDGRVVEEWALLRAGRAS